MSVMASHSQNPETSHAPVKAVAAVSTELMKNYTHASVVSGQGDFAVAQDARGEPLLFSVGADKRLFVIHRDPAGSTGWKQDDLSSGLGQGLEVSAFEVSQDRQGNLYLVVAVHPAGKPDEAQLYVSPRLSHDPAVTDWSKVGGQWRHRPFNGGPVRITRIRMGTADDGTGAPLTLAAVVDASKEAKHFQINADASDPSWSWKPYELPENATRLLDLAIGRMGGDRGVYALYEVGRGQTLEFTSMPDEEYGKRARYELKLPAMARRIAVVPGVEGTLSDDVYAAGEGVFLFRESAEQATPVAPAGVLSGVDELVVRQDAGNVAVWTVSAGRLSYLHASSDALQTWSAPVVLGQGIRRLVALRNQVRLTNALFTVTADDALEYRYQDPRTQLWASSRIPLPDSGKLLEFNCYTSQVTLTGPDGTSVALSKLRVRASEWVQATLNGATHVLDPQHEVEVETDVQGRLTIINPVSSLSTPTFLVRGDVLDGEVTVEPASRVAEKLKQVQTGNDFLKIRGRDGRAMASSISREQRDTAAKAVKELMGVAHSLKSTSTPDPMLQSVPRVGDSPGNAWGVVLSGPGTGFFQGAEAGALVSSGAGASLAMAGLRAAADGDLALSAQGRLISDVGSFLESLVRGLERAARFTVEVLEGAARFVVKIGEQVVQFLITAAEQAYKAVHWVLKETLGLDLDDLVDYLGFLFSWEDIVVTHDVLVNLINQAIDRGRAEIGKAEGKIDEFFTGLIERARQLAPIQAKGAEAAGREGVKALQAGSPHQAEETKLAAFANSPVGNFANYHLQHSAGAGGGQDLAPKLAEEDPLRATLNDVVEIWEKIRESVERLGKTMGEGFLEGKLSFNDFLRQLSSDAVVGLLDVFKTILMKLVRFGERLIGMAQDLINKPIELPLISGLYKKYVGNKMTVLDAIALLIAVPVTTVYKLLTGEAPFPFVQAEAPRMMAAFAGDMPGADAAPADGDSELSQNSRYKDKDKKPRTFGLDTMKGAGIWGLIALGGGAVGGVGYGVFKLLSRVDRINTLIIKPLYNGLERVKTFALGVASFLAPLMVVLKLALWLGKVIWLTVQATKGMEAIAGPIRFGRWAVGGLAVLAEYISVVDPAEKAGPIVRMIGSTLDVLLAIPYAVVRSIEHAKGDDPWLLGVDVLEGVNALLDWVATLCSGSSKLIDEGVSKTVLVAVSAVITVFSTGMLGALSVTPILMDKVIEPL